MVTIYSDLKTIYIKFPSKRFKEYLARINKDDDTTLGYIDINKILLWSYEDFMVGKNSLDDLSDICNYLHTLLKSSDYSDLEKALNYGSELSFYIRDIKTRTDIFVSDSMITLKNYVEKIKGYGEK